MKIIFPVVAAASAAYVGPSDEPEMAGNDTMSVEDLLHYQMGMLHDMYETFMPDPLHFELFDIHGRIKAGQDCIFADGKRNVKLGDCDENKESNEWDVYMTNQIHLRKDGKKMCMAAVAKQKKPKKPKNDNKPTMATRRRRQASEDETTVKPSKKPGNDKPKREKFDLMRVQLVQCNARDPMQAFTYKDGLLRWMKDPMLAVQPQGKMLILRPAEPLDIDDVFRIGTLMRKHIAYPHDESDDYGDLKEWGPILCANATEKPFCNQTVSDNLFADEPGKLIYIGSTRSDPLENQSSDRCSRFFLTTDKIYGSEAENTCKSFGLDLASIVNDEESDMTRSVLNSEVGNAAWIGAIQNGDGNADGHYFTDGTRMEYTQWGTGKPNGADKKMTITYKKDSYVDGWADVEADTTKYRAFCVKNNYCRDDDAEMPYFGCKRHVYSNGVEGKRCDLGSQIDLEFETTSSKMIRIGQVDSSEEEEGRCVQYFMTQDRYQGDDAVGACMDAGMEMASIRNTAEDELAHWPQDATWGKGMFIGLITKGGDDKWVWTDTMETPEDVGYENWMEGQPNDNGNFVISWVNGWGDIAGDGDKHRVLCQKECFNVET